MSVDISKLIDADLLDEYHQGLPLSNADLAEVKSQFNPAFNPVSNLSLNFSTDEKVVGTWIDGKPLYQKTVSFGGLPNNTEKSVAHEISYLKYCIDFNIVGKKADANTHLKLNYPASSSYAHCYINNTYIVVKTSSNLSSYTESYVTLLYTKTTDDE